MANYYLSISNCLETEKGLETVCLTEFLTQGLGKERAFNRQKRRQNK